MQNYCNNLTNTLKKALLIGKYEFLMSRILIFITLITTILNALLFMFLNSNTHSYSATSFTLLIILFFSHFIFSIAYFLSAAISFYQGVFGRNAYLTHSLPIPLDSILISKIIVFFIWAIIGFAECLITLFAIKDVFNSIYELIQNNFLNAIYIAIICIVLMLLEIIYIFMIAAIVHKKKAYTMIYGILVYFSIKIIFAIMLVMLLNTMIDYYTISQNHIVIFISLLCIICYCICRYIVKNRLSL